MALAKHLLIQTVQAELLTEPTTLAVRLESPDNGKVELVKLCVSTHMVTDCAFPNHSVHLHHLSSTYSSMYYLTANTSPKLVYPFLS